jgi:ribonuclease HI
MLCSSVAAPNSLQWQQPSEGWWKCNVDASFYGASGQTGWGWCVRNDHGIFVAAGTNICNHHLATCEGEAMAIIEALRTASARGWSQVVFESDSKNVVDAIYAKHNGVSEFSSIIHSIKLLLNCNPNFEVKFIKRQANMAAHNLTRAVISWSSRTFFNSIPRCIEHIIMNEMSWLCFCKKKKPTILLHTFLLVN